MTPHQPIAADPILAMLPELRGRRILRPCVLYARLGRGGMGAVYLAKHLTLMQKQVVKCLWLMGGGNPVDGEHGEAFVDRFQQEARIAAEMTHQNLVRVTHVDRLGELHYLVMEHVDGEDVELRVRRRGPMDEATALTMLLGAAQGLGYAHARGIVHRDVKPANLMISTHGEVKVIDLGLARAIDSSQRLGATIGTLGTPRFMAPEQWDSAAVGPTADVWALGAVLFHALTGRSHLPDTLQDASAIRRFVGAKPFADQVVSGLKLGRGARRLLRRCLASDPHERFADARELTAALLELVPGDERLLADPEARRPVHGDEPDEVELRQLQAALERGELDRPASDPTIDVDRLDETMPMPGAAVRARADTVAPPPRTATPAVARPSPTPSTPARPLARHRRNAGAIGWLSFAAGLAIVAAAGVAMWPRIDHQALLTDAMAAIYQERFADADGLLQQLEASPAFADQARRLRIDVAIRDAERLGPTQPVAALQRLTAAQQIAARLLIARDTDAAQQQLQTSGAPMTAAIEAALAAALQVQSPLPGTVVTHATQEVIANFTPGALQLVATLQGAPLAPADGPACTAVWQAPDHDGPADLCIVVEEPVTRIRRVVTVPVTVRRGAAALHVDPPAQPSHTARLSLAATADNGPLLVRAAVTAPDGSQHQLDLGEHDGPFRFDFTALDGVDGAYHVRLEAMVGAEPVSSPVCEIVVDRRSPQLVLAPVEPHTSTRTLWLRGRADERCRVFVVEDERLQVDADAELGFALPLPLPDADGPLVLHLGVRDAAGNEDRTAAEVRVVVDRTAPTFDAAALHHADRAAGDQVAIAGRLDEPGEVTVDGSAVAATGDDGAFQIAATLPTGTIEQTATLRLTGRDRAGNAAPPVELQVFVDRCGPRILPGAADGSWWSEGHWLVKIEDQSGPCQVTLGGETKTADGGATVRFVRRASTTAITLFAVDQVGNRSTRDLSGPGIVDVRDVPAPGPAWGTPVDGSPIDPALHLHERVLLSLCDVPIVMRLVRPLRDDELPPPNQRDPRAVAMLQGQPPFYLAETELPAAVFAAWLQRTDKPPAEPGFRFDPRSCQWLPRDGADANEPLDPMLAAATAPGERARWPATHVTPTAARAFCLDLGLRLPTEQEWQFVARMGARGRYGWRPHGPLQQRANLADLQLAELAPGLAAYDTSDDGFAGLAPADAFPLGDQSHPWGFRNLLGNVAEWCTTGRDRVVARGGSWLSEPRDLRVDELPQDRLITGGAWDCVGLRVARDI